MASSGTKAPYPKVGQNDSNERYPFKRKTANCVSERSKCAGSPESGAKEDLT